jgi:hypothetical protein
MYYSINRGIQPPTQKGTPMTPPRMDLVAAVRHHAIANYNSDGWDFVVECWEDEDILEHIGNAQTADAAIASIRRIVKIQAERRHDIESEAF